MKNFIMAMVFGLTTLSANADWAVAPGLTSNTLWVMVAEGRAKVVSSVAFGGVRDIHMKQTVFTISNTLDTDKNIKWAVRSKGMAPVMCTEKWNDINYLGSWCSIPGITDLSD
jgi:hypothetical protein